MTRKIKLKKGFDIRLVGEAEKKMVEVVQPETFALKPADFPGLKRPKIIVEPGDTVKAGTPIFHERENERVLYTSPVSGEIAEIVRGEKRKILEVRILADKEITFEEFQKYTTSDIPKISADEAKNQLLKSGVWVNLIQRPFGIIPDPDQIPKSIFISGFDTSPLAPDYSFILKNQNQYFQVGVDILRKFTSGTVHINIQANCEVATIFSKTENAKINSIHGVHPAGNVGVQIHHIDPISKGDLVWTINPVGVAYIGKLFLDGKYDTSKRIALTGSQVKNRAYVQTYIGANLNKLLLDNIIGDENRYISGNVLTGEGVGKDDYLGYYHNQITVIPEGKYEEFLGWAIPSIKKLSFHRAFGLSLIPQSKRLLVDTNEHGEVRNFVISGAFEKVLPMDILPTYLFKAILAKDYDEMEALGIYEVIEEDVALCEFIDVSKNPIQKIIRKGINLILEG